MRKSKNRFHLFCKKCGVRFHSKTWNKYVMSEYCKNCYEEVTEKEDSKELQAVDCIMIRDMKTRGLREEASELLEEFHRQGMKNKERLQKQLRNKKQKIKYQKNVRNKLCRCGREKWRDYSKCIFCLE